MIPVFNVVAVAYCSIALGFSLGMHYAGVRPMAGTELYHLRRPIWLCMVLAIALNVLVFALSIFDFWSRTA